MNSQTEKKNCFAWSKDECLCLNKKICLKRECPFFKTTEKYYSDLEKYGGEKIG